MTVRGAWQWRALVGPAYEPADSAYYYAWRDLVTYGLNPAAAVTTLSSALADGAASLATASAANLRGAGGVWVGPNGAGQAWEYISYSGKGGNTLTGLRREPAAVREHNGVHGAGAVVRQWWEIAGDTGRLALAEQLDDALAVITWRAEVAGLLAPQAALRNNHLVVVQTRNGPTAAWDNMLIGFLANPKIGDDGSRTRGWTLQIVSVANIVNGYVGRTVRVGELDLARAGETTSDTTLAKPWKEFLSGEFTAAEPDFGGGSAIDDQADTLWFAERLRGQPPSVEYPGQGSALHEGRFISSLRIKRWPGEPPGYRWLEMIAPEASYSNTLNNGWLCQKTEAAAVWIEFNGLDTSPGDLIIFAENERLFREANPLAEPIAIFEIGSGFFDALQATGDAVAVYIGDWFPTTAWGVGGRPQRPGGGSDDGHAWTANTIPVPGVGQIIRYSYNGAAVNDRDHFLVDYIDYAGYRSTGEDPWLQLKLPALGLAIRDNITAGSPAAGQKLYILHGDGPGTEGLTAAGTIQVGMEQIAYSSRATDGVVVSARGANGSTAAAHQAGDLVRVVAGGVATLGQLISRIEWKRAQAPYPESFKIRVTALDSARVPSDDNHDADYTTVADVTNHGATSYSLALSPTRATHVIIEIDHMNVYPARPRLNALRVMADTSAFDANTMLAAGDAVNVVERVLLNAGLPAAAIAKTLGGVTLDQVETAEGESVWSVAADLCVRCNLMLEATRLGSLAVAPNSLPAGVLTASATYTEVESARVEFVQTAAAAVAQVRQPYRLADGTVDTARYPTDPVHPAGQLVDMPENRYASAAAALGAAQRQYILQRWPTTLVVTCADGQPSIRPGMVVMVQWQLAPDMQPISRKGIVVGADHEIADGMWGTVLTVLQIDREWTG